jgi:hypothetical protein
MTSDFDGLLSWSRQRRPTSVPASPVVDEAHRLHCAKIVEAHQRWLKAVAEGEASARAATCEALRGCAIALADIEKELKALQYPVTPLIQPCPASTDKWVAQIERKTGLRVPAILVAFWKSVGQVSFVGFGSDARHTDFWAAQGVQAEVCDGLAVDGCSPDWVAFMLEQHHYIESIGSDEEEDSDWPWDNESFCFYVSDDGHTKDGVTQHEMFYGLRPGNDWLPTFENFEWARLPLSSSAAPVDFMGYLRTTVLECACFPGLLGDEAFEPIRRRLLANVKLF